jgi:P27 family predicted phage terminase small subunit
MGRRGPAPQPPQLKILRGNPGHRPIEDNIPKPRPVPPERPAWLTGEARREWDRIVPELDRLGLLTVVDRAALAGYCQSYSRWVQAERVLKREGMTFATLTGYIQQRPEVAIAQKYLQLVKAFCAEFGLTPSARGRMTIPGQDDEEEDNPFDV